MTIEFHCHHCDRLLRTADDKAGVAANCPGCGNLVTVPGTSTPSLNVSGRSEESSPTATPVAPAGLLKDCPMCGARNSGDALRCGVCGEPFGQSGSAAQLPGTPVSVEIGPVLEKSWALFQSKFGLCAVSGIITTFGQGLLAVGGVAGYVALLVMLGIEEDSSGEIPPQGVLLMVGGGLAFFLVYLLASVYLTMGQLNLMLKIVKGEPAQLSDMFRVGRFYGRAVMASGLFMVAVGSGLCLFIIPGFLLMLVLGQFPIILLDQDVGVMESLKRSYHLTKQNLGTIFVLYIIAMGISFACSMVCNFLNVLTVSFSLLMACIVYQLSLGRTVARS